MSLSVRPEERWTVLIRTMHRQSPGEDLWASERSRHTNLGKSKDDKKKKRGGLAVPGGRKRSSIGIDPRSFEAFENKN